MSRKNKYDIFLKVKDVENKTLEQLAKEVGVTTTTVYTYLKRSGKECIRGGTKALKVEEEILNEIKALGDVSDLKVADIVKKLNNKYSWTKVSKVLDKGVVEYRKKGVHSNTTSEQILKLFDEGVEPKHIVKKVGVTRQHVYKIIGDYRNDEWLELKKAVRNKKFNKQCDVLNKVGLEGVLLELSEKNTKEVAAVFGVTDKLLRAWLVEELPNGYGDVDWELISDLRYETLMRKRYPFMFDEEELAENSLPGLSRKYNVPVMNLYRVVRRLGTKPKNFTEHPARRKVDYK